MFKIFSAIVIIGVFIAIFAVFTSDTSKTVVEENAIVVEKKEVLIEKDSKASKAQKEADTVNNRGIGAGDTKVLKAVFKKTDNTWNVSVTLKHPDDGWDHYANFWQIIDKNGEIITKRVLVHPHVDEQPFTRSMSGVEIPRNIKVVFVEAGDNIHGMSDSRLKVDFGKYTDSEFSVEK